MDYQQLQKEAQKIYAGALLLDELTSAHARRLTRTLCALLAILCLFIWVAGITLQGTIELYAHFFEGGFLFFTAGWMVLSLLSAFYNSYFFLDIEPALAEQGIDGNVALSYEVARIITCKPDEGATRAFLRSDFGSHVLLRLGLETAAVATFLKTKTSSDNAPLEFDAGKVTAPVLAQALYRNDKGFSAFLFAEGIQEKDFQGTCEWVARTRERAKRSMRWWGKENLGRTPGIGKRWSYGQIDALQKFSNELFPSLSSSSAATAKEVDQLETVLVRAKGSNALIVADLGSGEMDLIYGLIGRIQAGTVLPALEGKRVLQFMAGRLIDAAQGDKTAFETAFITMLNQAVYAGNIILLFDDLPSLVGNAASIGSDIPTLLAPFLAASGITIIAIADKGRFHQTIERNSVLHNGFEIIRVAEKDEKLLTTILENEVPRIEAQTKVLFTFQAIEALADSVPRYFSDSVPLEKAKDLLEEIPTANKRSGKHIVTREDVLSLIAAKTGVPQEGGVSEHEKEKLLNLEGALHGRVIGQEEAITALANSMRRARAGLRNPNRPLGSFLFLGPTGVGKTETAKALEEVFFGPQVPMLRLDMSEYSDSGALQRLIGSSQGSVPGTLVNLLRDQQYGVLLLDEFEKASGDVHNLFLQVLDEGIFSDALGKKVNARNTIIIATSNAGSDLIFALASEGKELSKEQDAFIAQLIERGIFRPELINRFDGVILFHPLQKEQMAAIAELQVARLAERLAAQGLKLSVTPDLIEYLVRNGFDEKFGARSMNRILQERVEKLFAESLIKGELKAGSSVEIISSPDTPDTLVIRTL